MGNIIRSFTIKSSLENKFRKAEALVKNGSTGKLTNFFVDETLNIMYNEKS